MPREEDSGSRHVDKPNKTLLNLTTQASNLKPSSQYSASPLDAVQWCLCIIWRLYRNSTAPLHDWSLLIELIMQTAPNSRRIISA